MQSMMLLFRAAMVHTEDALKTKTQVSAERGMLHSHGRIGQSEGTPELREAKDVAVETPRPVVAKH